MSDTASNSESPLPSPLLNQASDADGPDFDFNLDPQESSPPIAPRQLDGSSDVEARLAEHHVRVTKSLSNLNDQASRILQILDDRSQFDRARELSIEVMQRELQEFRQKGVEHWKREILLSLLALYDNMTDCLAGAAENKATGDVEWLREMVLETLSRQDVELMEFDDSRLDKERHKIVRTVSTNDPSQHLTIDQIVRRGFLWHQQVLRPEQVVVRRCDQSVISESSSGASNDS